MAADGRCRWRLENFVNLLLLVDAVDCDKEERKVKREREREREGERERERGWGELEERAFWNFLGHFCNYTGAL